MGSIAGIPVVAQTVNTVNNIKPVRKVMDKVIGIHADAELPKFHSNSLRKRFTESNNETVETTTDTKGKVALFVTCYGNKNEPDVVEDMVAILRHNNIQVKLVEQEKVLWYAKNGTWRS